MNQRLQPNLPALKHCWLLITLGFFGFMQSANAQGNVDSKGTNFWICFPGNASSPAPQLYITGEQAATVTIDIPGISFNEEVNVTAGGLQVIDLPTSAQVQSQFAVDKKGIHITATKEVTVYGMNAQNASTDAYLAFPTDAIGTEYYVMAYFRDFSFQLPTQTTIVASQNSTTVTITTTVTGGGFTAGVPANITLQQGDVYQLRSITTGADYTGTKITSNKPISVFGGAQCTNISGNLRACDHLVEQLPPLGTWGQSFVTVPLATRTAGDVFRFLAQKNNTQVRVNGTVVATLNAGKYYETILSSTSYNRITANEAILVGQYSRSSQADNVTSDPFFALVPPDEQFLNAYVVSAGTSNIPNNYLNITSLTSNKGSVRVDGAAVSSGLWNVIPGTSFSGAKVPVSAGVHKVTSNLRIGVLVYGFGSFDSYGYLGGQSFGDVAEVCCLTLTPVSGTAKVGTEQCFKALVKDDDGNPVSDITVDFTITGANPGSTGFAVTNSSGVAEFCYTGEKKGTDNVVASIGSISDNSTFVWTEVVVEDTTVFYSKATGDLHKVATWGVNPDGSGTSPTNFGAGKTFNLANRSGTYNLTGNWTVDGTLFRPAGSQLHIKNYTLSVASLTGTGVFAGTTESNLNIAGTTGTGSGIGTLNFSSAGGMLNNFTMNRAGSGASATIGSPLSIYNAFTVTSGKVNTGGLITLKSSATKTAYVAQVTGTISGNVTVERYISAKRAWRLLDAPVGGTQTIKAAWQEGAANTASNPSPGYGTHITGGVVYGTASNGFDINSAPLSTSFSSIKAYNNATGTWDSLPNTNATTVGNKPIMLFVRGDRSIALSGPNVTAKATVLRATGPLKVGIQNLAVNASGFTALPNPYASPVDFGSLSKAVIQNNFYVWDPKLGGANGKGAFVNVSWNGSAYEMTPTPVSPISQYIQSGQAFMVRSKGSAGNLVVQEVNKSATPSANVFANAARNTEPLRGLKLNLQIEEDGSAPLLDGIFISMNSRFSEKIDDMDVVKLPNLDENLAIVRDQQMLLIDRRPMITLTDAVQLRLWNTVKRDYLFEINPVNLATSGLYVYLKDKYLHTTMLLDRERPTTVRFAVTSDPASANPDRFILVMATKALQPETTIPDGITIYPNPIQGRTINLRFVNQPEGTYKIALLNELGQTILQEQLKHGGGSTVKSVQLKNGLAKGMYQLQVSRGGFKTSLKVLHNQ